MVSNLVKKIQEYEYYHGKTPNAIYVGRSEWYELMEDAKIFNYTNGTDDNKFMDISVIEVDKESYLKVGIVE